MSVALISRLMAIALVPAFPGATNSSVTFGLCFIFHASACSRAPPPTINTLTSRNSLPFDGRRWLTGDIVYHTVHARHFIDDAVRYAGEQIIRKPRPVSGHGVLAGHGTQGDKVAVRSEVPHDPHALDVGQHG